MSDIEGTFQTLLGSLQSHFEDRLKSPFGGAFIVAWVAINWKAILILLASDTSIEARIFTVSNTYFSSSWSVLWLPLIWAAIGVIGYYLVATAFVIFYECYGLLRRLVERWFDSYRWVPPSTYIETKRATRAQIEELSSLASDQLEKIAQLREDTSAAEARRTTAEAKADQELARSNAADVKVKNMSDELDILRITIRGAQERNRTLELVAKNLDQAAKNVAEQAKKKLDIDAEPKKTLATLMRPVPGEEKHLIDKLEEARFHLNAALSSP
jgi:hypothetical protein